MIGTIRSFLLLFLLSLVYRIVQAIIHSNASSLHHTSSIKSLCPVSNSIFTRVDARLTYPLELFDPKYRPNLPRKGIRFSCTALDQSCDFADPYPCADNFPNYPHRYLCGGSKFSSVCPVRALHLDRAVLPPAGTRPKAPPPAHSCGFAKALEEDKHTNNGNGNEESRINIYVLGGSVTAGYTGSEGCCCERAVDPTCPPQSEDPSIGSGVARECRSLGTGQCGWVYQLSRWAEAAFGGRVVVHNRAYGGKNSLEYVVSNMDAAVFDPSERDVVLIDFAVNDYSRDNGALLTLGGIEALLRRFLNAPRRPALVILESSRDPSAVHLNSSDWDRPTHRRVRSDDAPYLPYRLLATHYNVPLWSYPDAFFEPHSGTDEGPPVIGGTPAERMKLLQRVLGLRFLSRADCYHPAWYIHLLYADLVSALLLRLKDQCSIHVGAKKPNKIRPPPPLPAPLLQDDSVLFELDCLTNDGKDWHERNSVRDGSTRVQSTLGFNAHQHSGSTETIHPRLVNKGFSLVNERKRKPGYISIFPNTTISDGLKPSIIEYKFGAFLSNGSFPAIRGPELWTYDDMSLIVQFLRTYENAGVLQVFVCGVHIASIDALWSTHSSVATTAYLRVCNFRDFCGDDLRTYSVVFNHSHGSFGEQARGNQKVKLIAADVCVESVACTRSERQTHFLQVY